MIKCIKYESCNQMGRQNSTYSSIGRKTYYCKHSNIQDDYDKYMKSKGGFIGFGTNTYESPLTVKTSPRWCPKR